MSCASATFDVVAGWDAIAPADGTCGAVGVEVSGRVAWVRPDPGIATTVDPTRARLTVGVADGPARAIVRLAAVRSAGALGYLGVDGEAFVPEVDGAVVGGAWARAGLHGDIGIVPDLWIAGADRAWGLPGVAPTLGALWIERADLGAQVGWAAPGGWVWVDAALTSGEGFALRERNEGKDLGASISAAPLASGRFPHAVVLTGFARDGSRGVAVARDSRLGFRAAGQAGPVAYGAEWLAAWGVDADATRTPVGASGWLTAAPWGPVVAVGRVDRWAESGAVAVQALGACGVRLPTHEGHVVALAGVSHVDSGDLAPVVGAEPLTVGTTWFVHIDGALRASFSEGS